MSEEKEAPKATAQTYGALDTSNVDEECWMVKIPQSLAQVWDKVAQGSVLGELVFKKGGGGTKPSLTIHVAPSVLEAQDDDDDDEDDDDDDEGGTGGVGSGGGPNTGTGNNPTATASSNVIPLTYSLQAMTKDIPGYVPFSRNPQTGAVRLWGTVSRTANLQVEKSDENYRKQLKERLIHLNVNSNRFVKPVDAPQSVITKQQQTRKHRQHLANLTMSSGDNGASAAGGDNSFSSAVSQYGKRKNEMSQDETANPDGAADGPDSKRSRQFSPDDPIRSVIFELFSKEKYWTVKDLKTAAAAGGATISKRSEAEIRDVLREIGEYHRSGDHKTMWELRKEFQQQEN